MKKLNITIELVFPDAPKDAQIEDSVKNEILNLITNQLTPTFDFDWPNVEVIALEE